MENLNQLLNIINSQSIISLMFKAFAIVFSLMYLMYGLIISKQTKTMTKTLDSSRNQVLYFIASFQIAFGVILIILAIFLL